MVGIGGMSAAMNPPPEPSVNIGITGSSGMSDGMPRPEGEPEAAKKPTSGIGSMSAAINPPPEPSLDIVSTGAGITDGTPRPEGESEAARKPSGKQR